MGRSDNQASARRPGPSSSRVCAASSARTRPIWPAPSSARPARSIEALTSTLEWPSRTSNPATTAAVTASDAAVKPAVTWFDISGPRTTIASVAGNVRHMRREVPPPRHVAAFVEQHPRHGRRVAAQAKATQPPRRAAARPAPTGRTPGSLAVRDRQRGRPAAFDGSVGIAHAAGTARRVARRDTRRLMRRLPGTTLGQHYARCYGCGVSQPAGLHMTFTSATTSRSCRSSS